MQFRKIPVVIEAFRLGVDNLPDWFMDRVSDCSITLHGGHPRDRGSLAGASIDTLEGVMKAERGDYIIRGVIGEIYPCKPDIFAATYEPVEEATPANAGATPREQAQSASAQDSSSSSLVSAKRRTTR